MAKANYELDNGVALITLNDPATLNAIAVDMTEELTVFFERASEEARCIVLTGEGRAFSSGANLASGAPPLDADGQPDLGGRLEATFNPFVTMLRDLPIPYVTAVNGAAAGIGCSFALLGDLIVAGESAYLAPTLVDAAPRAAPYAHVRIHAPPRAPASLRGPPGSPAL
jgi:2-(1,2-epoxy-1,2-dihydrophenyl)acetyl-CoA isomerase